MKQIVDRHADQLGHRGESLLRIPEAVQGCHPGQRLKASDVRADRPLTDDLDHPDVAQGGDVGATAELQRVRTSLQHSNCLAVLVAEKGDGPHRFGLLTGDLKVTAIKVGQDLGVGPVLYSHHLFSGHSLIVAEVESQTIRTHVRALLLYMVAEHVPESPVEDVGGGVVAADRRPTVAVDARPDLLADLDGAVESLDVVDVEGIEDQSGVEDPKVSGLGGNGAGVADLAAGFSVERCPVEHHGPVTNVKHDGVGLVVLMSDEMSGSVSFQ